MHVYEHVFILLSVCTGMRHTANLTGFKKQNKTEMYLIERILVLFQFDASLIPQLACCLHATPTIFLTCWLQQGCYRVIKHWDRNRIPSPHKNNIWKKRERYLALKIWNVKSSSHPRSKERLPEQNRYCTTCQHCVCYIDQMSSTCGKSNAKPHKGMNSTHSWRVGSWIPSCPSFIFKNKQ